jgi:GT2 family glycosyltransferase
MGTSDRERVDAPGPVDFISGCCLLLRREVFEAHGLYDAAFFAYDEDADWCLRMRARGLRLDYTPAARLRHKVSASLRKQDPGQGTLSPLQHYFQTRNRLWILRRHGGSSLRSFWLRLRFSLRVLRYAAANLLLGRPTKTRAILRGLRDGWRGVA